MTCLFVPQRLTQSLGFSVASLEITGLQNTSYTVQSLTTVSGYTLQDQASVVALYSWTCMLKLLPANGVISVVSDNNIGNAGSEPSVGSLLW